MALWTNIHFIISHWRCWSIGLEENCHWSDHSSGDTLKKKLSSNKNICFQGDGDKCGSWKQPTTTTPRNNVWSFLLLSVHRKQVEKTDGLQKQSSRKFPVNNTGYSETLLVWYPIRLHYQKHIFTLLHPRKNNKCLGNCFRLTSS